MHKQGSLNEEQYQRYHRNLLLDGVGPAGQEKLFRAGVLMIGAGGLGSPAAFYIAAAGVGRIGLIDGDTVSLSNLQRQILHTTPDLSRPKVQSAAEKLKALNPALQVEPYHELFQEHNAADLIGNYDIVLDCTDNFQARYLINRTCVDLQKPFVYGGVLAWAGQAFTVVPGQGPCFRCLFREKPPPGAPTTSEVGILGAVAGVIGVIQAAEAIRYILGVGELLVGRILTYDALNARFFEIPVQGDDQCPDCKTIK